MTERFQGSMLDCIRNTAQAAINIADHREINCAALITLLDSLSEPINEILLIGSGTSSTTAITSRCFVERVTGIATHVVYPNDFLYNCTVRNPQALHVFTSQTGTSKVCFEAMKQVQQWGYPSLVISQSAQTPMAQAADCFLTMDCGIEEYPMRTTGYSATVMTHMAMAISIAQHYGRSTETEAAKLTEEIRACSKRLPQVIERTLEWMKQAKRKMLRSDLIVFTGADALAGVSLEGAMKVWETPQIASVGYEIEEGIHGPNYGYNSRHCVIVLNDGGREDQKCRGLARYMKEVWNNGFLIGAHPIDEEDLELPVVSPDLCVIDFAAVVQTIAFKLAEDQGRDLGAHHDNSRMNAYFKTHQ